MARICGGLSLIAAIVIISGCGSQPHVGPTGSVSGFVYIPAGGAARTAGAPTGYVPLSNAEVRISGTSLTTYTDANGYYLLAGVPTGTRTLTITKSGYDTITKSVEVVNRETTVATPENSAEAVITLLSGGDLSVATTPASASIYIDSVDTGRVSPHTFDDLAPGTHTVSLRLDNYVPPATQTVTIAAGQTTDLTLTLQPFACFSDADCNDNSALTLDSCSNPGTAQSDCVNTAIACNVDGECDDNNSATGDSCVNGGTAAAACSNTVCSVRCEGDYDCSPPGGPLVAFCVFPGRCDSDCIAAR